MRKEGFSLHAGTGIHANDRLGLERLCRYGLRAALALGRLLEAPDGTVLYEMKRRFSDGRHVLRFTPREFVLRLCASTQPYRLIALEGYIYPPTTTPSPDLKPLVLWWSTSENRSVTTTGTPGVEGWPPVRTEGYVMR